MKCEIIYLLIAVVIVAYFIINNQSESFKPIQNDSIYFKVPFLFNVPTRNYPIYADIRGPANEIYIKDSMGTIRYMGYKFGPYLYDAQGNLIKQTFKNFYVA